MIAPTPAEIAAWKDGKGARRDRASALAAQGLGEDAIREALQGEFPGMWDACYQNVACAAVMAIVGERIYDHETRLNDRKNLVAKGLPARLADKDRGAALREPPQAAVVAATVARRPSRREIPDEF